MSLEQPAKLNTNEYVNIISVEACGINKPDYFHGEPINSLV
jgi:hypothetical protein